MLDRPHQRAEHSAAPPYGELQPPCSLQPPLSLLCFGLNKPRDPSCSSYCFHSRLFTIFVAPLWTLAALHTFFFFSHQKLCIVLKVRLYQCTVKRENHFPQPSGSSAHDAPQDMVSLSCLLSTLLTHVQISVNQIVTSISSVP